MVKKKTFTIIGGDMRQAHLTNSLAFKESGYKIYGMFLEPSVKLSGSIHISDDIQLVMPQSDIIIFPLPLLGPDGYVNSPAGTPRITLESYLEYLCPETVVLAGKVSRESADLFHAKGIQVVDYLEREEFAVLNAIPAALYKMRLK